MIGDRQLIEPTGIDDSERILHMFGIITDENVTENAKSLVKLNNEVYARLQIMNWNCVHA